MLEEEIGLGRSNSLYNSKIIFNVIFTEEGTSMKRSPFFPLLDIGNGASFDPLLRESQIRYSDHTACRPMLTNILFEQFNRSFSVFLSIRQIQLYISQIRTGYAKFGEYSIQILQRLQYLCLNITRSDKFALGIMRELSRDIDSIVDAVALRDSMIPKIMIVGLDSGHCMSPFAVN